VAAGAEGGRPMTSPRRKASAISASAASTACPAEHPPAVTRQQMQNSASAEVHRLPGRTHPQ